MKKTKEPAAKTKRRNVIDRKPAFLAALALGLTRRAAARAAKVHWTTHYDWLANDPDYAARYEAAMKRGDDALEDEAVERATVGVYEPNVFQGRFVYPQEEYEIKPAVTDRRGRVVKPARTAWRDKPGAAPLGVYRKSDGLLMFLLRGRMPEKYGRQALEVTGPQGGPIEIVERLNAARLRIAAARGA
jgi:hypothetical protein